MTKITLSFDDELVADIAKIARRDCTSVRAIIRAFLRDLAKTAQVPSVENLPQIQNAPEKTDRSF